MDWIIQASDWLVMAACHCYSGWRWLSDISSPQVIALRVQSLRNDNSKLRVSYFLPAMCTNRAESANVCRTTLNEDANYTCALSLMSWESLGDAGKREMAWSPAFQFVFSVIYTNHQDASEAMVYSHGWEIPLELQKETADGASGA